MKNAHESVITAIGNTPLVKLQRVTEGFQANVWAKVEFVNPGSSVKDRIALHIINQAEARGELKPGGTIVEATSGNTGAGLAMIAAVRGYKCIFVLPDKQSEEKRAALRAFGAKVVVTPTNVEPEDPRSYYSVAKRLAVETPNAFYANQYHNPDNPEAHYLSTGPELWDQVEGEIDVFIAGLGTGGTVSGIGRYLKEKKPDVQIVGVDPVGSIYYDYFKTGNMVEPFSYVLEGIGEDFLPSTMDFTYVDEVIRVTDPECFTFTRRLAQEEGLMVGGSCGAALAGVVRYLEQHDRPGLNIVVLLPDSGSRYLSKIYNDKWMEENGFLTPQPEFGTVGDVMDALGDRSVIECTSATSASDAGALMRQHGISQMPVLDDGKIRGVLTERALLDAALNGGIPDGIGDLVGDDYATVTRHSSVASASDLLRKVRVALVLDNKKLTGVLTRIDLIDHVARVTRG